MVTPARPTYSDAIEIAARREQQQMWQAAQTVRAHVDAGAGRDELLECLGLSHVAAPQA